MLDLLADPSTWIAFATLTVMEVVLGIDNVIFISVLVSKLPKEQADRARVIGIGLALLLRGPAACAKLDHRAQRTGVYRVRTWLLLA